MKNIPVNYWLANKHNLHKEYETRFQTYKLILDFFIQYLNELISSININGVIKGRIKGFEPFHRKLLIKCQKQKIIDPFKSINDLIGLRIVVPFLEDLKTIEDNLQNNFNIIEKEYKSRSLSISEFGYDSTHILIEIPETIRNQYNIDKTILLEIQLRTILQEAWAEVEHELVYKTSIDKIEDTIKRKLIALNATLSLADITFQEIRDYQRKKFNDLQIRHKKLLDKVSTLPEKTKKSIKNSSKKIFANIDQHNTDTNTNDLFIEAINAHLENNFEVAIDRYSKLILISPNHYIFNHRGLVYFALSEYEKAINDFTMAIDLEPNDTRVYTNRGLTYRMLHRYADALADFNKSLELNALWPDTFYGRSLTYYDLGNIKLAIEDCDKAITLKPDFKQAVRFKQFLLNQQL